MSSHAPASRAEAPSAPEEGRQATGRAASFLRVRVLRDGARRNPPEVALGVLVVAQVVSAGRLVRGMWFQLDAWEFLTSRGTIPGVGRSIWAPWGGHWETVPALLYRGLFEFFGMRHYTPYVLLADALHIGVVVFLFLLLKRLGAPRWLAFAAATTVLFFGAGSELFLTDAPLPLAAGLLCGLAGAYVGAGGDYAGDRRLGVAALLLLGVMCSAIGLVSIVLVSVLVSLRKGVRAAAWIVAPAVVLFAVWFVIVGHSGGRLQLTGDSIVQVPQFVWSGLSGAAGDWLGVPGTGGVFVLVLVLATVVVRDVDQRLRELAWAGLLAALAELTLCALANASLGLSAATASRYEYVAFVLMVPAGVVGALGLGSVIRNSVVGRHRVVAVLLTAFVVLAGFANGIRLERDRVASSTAFSQIYRTWILGTRDANTHGEIVLTPHPSDRFNEPLDMSLVNDLTTMRALPPTRGGPDRLEAESQFFVSVSTVDPRRFAPTHLTYHGLITQPRSSSGCRDVVPDGSGTPTIDVSTRQGTEVGILSNSTAVSTQVFRSYQGSATRTWLVPRGPIYVSTTAKDAVLRIMLNGTGIISVCHQ